MRDLSEMSPRERSVTISAVLAIGFLGRELNERPQSDARSVMERALQCLVHGAMEALDASVDQVIVFSLEASGHFAILDLMKAKLPPEAFEELKQAMLKRARDAGLTLPDDDQPATDPFAGFINGLDL